MRKLSRRKQLTTKLRCLWNNARVAEAGILQLPIFPALLYTISRQNKMRRYTCCSVSASDHSVSSCYSTRVTASIQDPSEQWTAYVGIPRSQSIRSEVFHIIWKRLSTEESELLSLPVSEKWKAFRQVSFPYASTTVCSKNKSLNIISFFLANWHTEKEF